MTAAREEDCWTLRITGVYYLPLYLTREEIPKMMGTTTSHVFHIHIEDIPYYMFLATGDHSHSLDRLARMEQGGLGRTSKACQIKRFTNHY